jgi:hypothetical protein
MNIIETKKLKKSDCSSEHMMGRGVPFEVQKIQEELISQLNGYGFMLKSE